MDTLPKTFKSLATLKDYKATTLKCPSCGAQLQRPQVGGTRTNAPYLCTDERLMFTDKQLHPRARQQYRPEHRDWGSHARWILT